MSVQIELYKGRDFKPVGKLDSFAVLREGLETQLNRSLEKTQIALRFFDVRDESPDRGKPTIVNLRARYGYANVTVIADRRIIYRHPHTVHELVARPLRPLLAEQDPNETIWGFGLIGPGLESLPLERPAPAVAGSVQIDPGRTERRGFKMVRVPEPEPPNAYLADFKGNALTAEIDSSVRVIATREAHQFLTTHPFSEEVEEGGFLIGRIHRDADEPKGFIAEVTGALPASHTGASLLHFTFTGDSFQAMNRAIAQTDQRLLGWYHTHLFAATEAMGLSSIDLDLHFNTFRLPWQLAGLVNIEGDEQTLRFYVRDGDTMAECPQWLAP